MRVRAVGWCSWIQAEKMPLLLLVTVREAGSTVRQGAQSEAGSTVRRQGAQSGGREHSRRGREHSWTQTACVE